ncbi:Hypothetical predicted protein [Mytilus galloprovincialis]|uniref:Uncharacterized protein n=1 Tax=Mytilus galloprovincialis TaxID=29158 RepID=A0A8B6HT47_MYTGA|nr:Hypothetical predicted protein [Mytilus galloprovincialis]
MSGNVRIVIDTVILGKIPHEYVTNKKSAILKNFGKLESLGIDAKEQNDPDLAESIENYLQTSITKKNNKYVTKLPWRENAPELPTNEDIAKRRTESVIRRLKKDPEMFRKYGEIITDQEQRGFIEKENPMDTESRLITYRLRLYFFGATCFAIHVKRTLMKHFRDNPSTTSTELQRNVYVDNVLTVLQITVTFEILHGVKKLLSEAGFNLRSWNSNSTELQNVAGRDKIGDNDDIVKILGMRWDRESDDLKFSTD